MSCRWIPLLCATALVAATTATADPLIGDGDSPDRRHGWVESLYGVARLDALLVESKLSDVFRPAYVHRDPPTRLHGEIAFTPRLSQIGLLKQWTLEEVDVTGEGKIEIDFAGGRGTNAIRLRDAYFALTGHEELELLAGHTSDLVAPFAPSVQRAGELLFAGNIGARRPQLRMTISNLSVFRVAGAVATGELEDAPTEQSSPMPGRTLMFQGAVEARTNRRAGSGLRIGASGHAAYIYLDDGGRERSWSIATHLRAALHDTLAIRGETYVGRNLGIVGGSTGAAVDLATGRHLPAFGFWSEVVFKPTQRHALVLGASRAFIAQPGNYELAIGELRSNGTVYGAVRYTWMESVEIGLEYLYWSTRYKDVGARGASSVGVNVSASL
jgi:hypothetical protein